MNRYVVAGLLEEMRAGKRVGVLTANGTIARAAHDLAASQRTDQELAVFRNGAERIEHPSGGTLVFRTIRGTAPFHGASLHVLFVDDRDGWTPDVEASARPALAVTGGEVVFA